MHLFAIEGNDFRTPDRRQKVEFTVQDGPKRSVSCQRHRTQKIISAIIYLRCPHCQGSQYRRSVYDINVKNPLGAKCIFCKSAMIQINPQPMAA